MKHLLRLLIAGIVLVIGIFPAKAVTYYHDDYTIGDLSYRLYYFYTANVPQYDDHVYVVSAAPDVKLKGDVVIPESVDILDMSLRVNGFLDHAFSGEDEMTSITFPKYDGEDAGWIGLSSYGSGVFQNCSSLKHIEIPAAVQYVSDWFKGCTSLEEITILGVDESAVTTIETLHIAYDTFADCPIKSFSFNRSIAISDFEEDRCILPDLNIENITIGEKVTYIPSGLFTGRTDILAYTVPDNIEYINEAAFKDCTNLAEINLGKVKEIRKNAFNNCPLSETLTIPGSVLSLDRCFQNCSGVRRLIMEPHEGERKETIKNNGEIFIDTPIESAYIDREFETPNAQFVTFPLLKSVEFGPNVTTLPSRLISSSPIEEIFFGENMKSFDEYSVPICLTKLVIPAQVEEIKMNAISTLTELTELIFEDGENPLHISYRKPSTIAYPMFETAGKLRKIYIGRDIMYDRYVSAATPDLVSSQQLYSPFRDLGHPVWVMVGPGVNHMDPDMFYDKKYTASTSVDRIAMPEGITLNGGYPYMKCVYPRDAVIKDGIIFDSYHTKLYWVDIDYEGEIELPETILEIGSVAMRSCVKASIDRIPENLEKIGDYAFDISGVSFENIVFPESMREIGIAAFASCKIDSVTINSGLEKIGQGALTHPNTVIYNARHAVLERNGNDKDAVFLPKSITFGEEVESIPAFLLYNAGVKEIALPQGLKEIEEYAFFNASLTALTIPGSVQNIGAGAFEDCVYLKNIVIEKGSAPLSVENGPLFGKRVKPLRVSIERDVLDKYESPVQVYSNAPTTLYIG
ncbi:MAG: leucine-rich repeat domain-containing protein, partial [Muribaculaceae bacterium]|nr:leucine-rich repeat domain-containing protein [Muribaculaceae bacterium]